MSFRIGTSLPSAIIALVTLIGMIGITGVSWIMATQPAHAQMSDPMANIPNRKIGESKLPVPRFLSVKSNKANVRRGPGKDYPVVWQYRKGNLPVMVVDEYNGWRKIRDHEGYEFWMLGNLLSSTRYVLSMATQFAEPVRIRPNDKSLIIAFLQKNALVSLDTCVTDYCLVNTEFGSGWSKRSALWGLLPNEQFD
jgi:SH3-like domain-containing protein